VSCEDGGGKGGESPSTECAGPTREEKNHATIVLGGVVRKKPCGVSADECSQLMGICRMKVGTVHVSNSRWASYSDLPGGRSLLRRLGRAVVVVLARAPDAMHRLRVTEFVRAVEHLRDGSRRAVQRDLTLARLVLAGPDVNHAPYPWRFDAPHLVRNHAPARPNQPGDRP